MLTLMISCRICFAYKQREQYSRDSLHVDNIFRSKNERSGCFSPKLKCFSSTSSSFLKSACNQK